MLSSQYLSSLLNRFISLNRETNFQIRISTHSTSCTSFEYYCCSQQNVDNIETIMSFNKVTSSIPVMWFQRFVLHRIQLVCLFFFSTWCSLFQFNFDFIPFRFTFNAFDWYVNLCLHSSHVQRVTVSIFSMYMQTLGGIEFRFTNISLKWFNAMETIVNRFQCNQKHANYLLCASAIPFKH